MKKIGFVAPWFGEKIGGGAEMELRGLVTHLNEAGYPVEVLTTCVESFLSDWNKNYHKPGDSRECGVPIKRFAVKKRKTDQFDAVNYKFMKNIPVEEEEEGIYLNEMINSPDLYRYISEHEQEYSLFVFIPYMFGTTYFGMQRCLEKAVLIPCLHDESYAYMEHFKELYPQIKGMIFHAKPEKELAEKIYNLNRVQTAVLGEGVYTDFEFDANRFRKKHNIEDPFILYAGRKDKGKNVDTLLTYFTEYKRRHNVSLKLVLIGGGHIEIPEESRSEIIDLGFVDLQDKYDAYGAALALCQPSTNESFSLVIMESWLCERPVLVHENCAVTKNFAIESNGGLYFDDYWKFEGCIEYFLNNSLETTKMGLNGNKYVKNNFSWDIIVEKYMEFFKHCML